MFAGWREHAARRGLYSSQPMLILGTDKTDTFLDHLPDHYLLIDDGPVIDGITLPSRRKITRFDPTKHSFNPLKGMTYQQARHFITLLDAIFPEGANTLTKKNSNFILLKALLGKTTTLDRLIPPSKDPAQQDAHQKIQTLLLSPVLKRVLLNPTNLPLDGILIARLDRAVLGDFDCFVLGNLLISQYQGTVVVPDFGFYACPNHAQLVRQNRLIVGLHFLDEVPLALRNSLLLGTVLPRHCTYEDAVCLAGYVGISKGTNAFADFIDASLTIPENERA